MKPKINDVVQLVDELPGESLANGAVGVIVAEFSEPEEAYEVEFCDDSGATITQVALRPNQFLVVSFT